MVVTFSAAKYPRAQTKNENYNEDDPPYIAISKKATTIAIIRFATISHNYTPQLFGLLHTMQSR